MNNFCIVTVPIPSTASATITPSTTVVSTTLPEGIVLSPIPQSHLVTPRTIVASDYRPFTTNFTMLVPGREQPFGMSTTVVERLQNNPSTFVDNSTTVYSPIMAFGSTISNHGRNMPPNIGMGFGSQTMPALTTNYVMAMR